MDVLDLLARHHAVSERGQEATRACYQAWEKDPYRENTCQLLMRCYACLGLRHQALQQYRLSGVILGVSAERLPLHRSEHSTAAGWEARVSEARAAFAAPIAPT